MVKFSDRTNLCQKCAKPCHFLARRATPRGTPYLTSSYGVPRLELRRTSKRGFGEGGGCGGTGCPGKTQDEFAFGMGVGLGER